MCLWCVHIWTLRRGGRTETLFTMYCHCDGCTLLVLKRHQTDVQSWVVRTALGWFLRGGHGDGNSYCVLPSRNSKLSSKVVKHPPLRAFLSTSKSVIQICLTWFVQSPHVVNFVGWWLGGMLWPQGTISSPWLALEPMLQRQHLLLCQGWGNVLVFASFTGPCMHTVSLGFPCEDNGESPCSVRSHCEMVWCLGFEWLSRIFFCLNIKKYFLYNRETVYTDRIITNVVRDGCKLGDNGVVTNECHCMFITVRKCVFTF